MELGYKERALKTLMHPASIKILASLERGTVKFSELMFEQKLNPSIVNRTLKSLIYAGIIEKCNGGYILTEKGCKVLDTLKKLYELL